MFNFYLGSSGEVRHAEGVEVQQGKMSIKKKTRCWWSLFFSTPQLHKATDFLLF